METIVQLTGISSGYTPEIPVTITAVAADPALFESVAVDYVDPSPTGSLVLTPVAEAEADTTVTVTVDNGKPKNNLCTRICNILLRRIKTPTLDETPDVTIET